jgi:hypothetical protein
MNNPDMSRQAKRFIHRAMTVGAVAAVTFFSTPAFAQEPARLPGEDNGVFQYIATFALGALILGAAFLNPKRSHLT